MSENAHAFYGEDTLFEHLRSYNVAECGKGFVGSSQRVVLEILGHGAKIIIFLTGLP
ncbi:MAG: hypothetical protein OXL96_13655 [Candidatus Poribacteria bacterium]|nr:hypothetical protein [Candidatus Poribacteria bacterium]